MDIFAWPAAAEINQFIAGGWIHNQNHQNRHEDANVQDR